MEPQTRKSPDTPGRFTTGGDSPTTTRIHRHYTDDSDNPGYVTETDGATSNTWYGGSINGDLGITVTGDTKTLSLIDPLGSVATTLTLGVDQHANNTLTLGPVGTYDEYGNPLTTSHADDQDPKSDPTAANTATAGGPIGYGWLGGKQRPTHASGLLLMGARLYNPTTGLFTSTDPIPGGNTTTYTYPQDPINQQDLDGHKLSWPWKKWANKAGGTLLKWKQNASRVMNSNRYTRGIWRIGRSAWRFRMKAQSQVAGGLAMAYSKLMGGGCKIMRGLRVCQSAIKIYPRGGVTVGTTYLTGYGSKAVTPDVLDHEKVHVKQWNRYGLTFAILYGVAGRNPCRNHWERQAGLAKGNYRC